MLKFFKVLNLPVLTFFLPWIAYFAIVWSNAVQVRSEGWYAAYIPHWGDGVAHISYMAAFAFRQTFPFMHPLFLGHPFTYSFAADMIGGLIARAGLPLWIVYNWWGFLLSVAMLWGLWTFMRYITRSQVMATLSMYFFLFSGGLGFRYLVTDIFFPDLTPKPEYFFNLLTQRENTNIVWLNIIVGELIPQRALLMALPLGVLLLRVWYRQFVESKRQPGWILFISGLLLGCMPIIHPHTLMFITSCLVFWVGRNFYLHRKIDIKTLLLIGIPAGLAGIYFLKTFVLASATSDGFFKWHPGWGARSKQINWLWFWFENWGLFLPLALIGSLFTVRSVLMSVIVPAWLWFGLANLFLFQPYDWDNSKLFTWVYLILTIPVLHTLLWLWKQRWQAKILAGVLLILVNLSGAIDALKMLDTKTYNLQIVHKREIELAEYVKQNTSAESIFLTSTTHRNWVPILTGRQILVGYLGWMWTYGIEADKRMKDVHAIYEGSPLAEKLLYDYKVNYVVVGPEERNEFRIDESFFSNRYKVLIDDGTTCIYQISPI